MAKTLAAMFAARAKGACPFCERDMSNPTFRDALSKREFEISGMCQECQDQTFVEPTEESDALLKATDESEE